MYKQISFVITAAIMLTAIITVALYTVNEAKAQGNATGANMTKKCRPHIFCYDRTKFYGRLCVSHSKGQMSVVLERTNNL